MCLRYVWKTKSGHSNSSEKIAHVNQPINTIPVNSINTVNLLQSNELLIDPQ